MYTPEHKLQIVQVLKNRGWLLSVSQFSCLNFTNLFFACSLWSIAGFSIPLANVLGFALCPSHWRVFILTPPHLTVFVIIVFPLLVVGGLTVVAVVWVWPPVDASEWLGDFEITVGEEAALSLPSFRHTANHSSNAEVTWGHGIVFRLHLPTEIRRRISHDSVTHLTLIEEQTDMCLRRAL